MEQRKVLVTGGAGYIGVHTVVELAQSGFEPIIVDNLSRSDPSLVHAAEKILGKKIIFVNADCRNADLLKQAFEAHRDIHSVIHFAAFKSVGESVHKPLMYYDN